MKASVVIIFVLLLSVNEIFGQDYYVTLHGGFGFGAAPNQLLTYSTTQSTSGTYISTSNEKNYSLGEGFHLTGGFGYNINPNISAELELEYSSGMSQDYGYNYNYTNGYSISNYNMYGTTYLAIPSIIISTNISEFKPYLKIGPALGIANITSTEVDNDGSPNSLTITERQTFLNGGLAFGYNAAIGVAYDVAKNIGITFEINDRSLSYAPTQGELQKYTINSVDQLPQTQTYFKKFVYKESITSNSNTTLDMSSPSQQIKINYPFSSVTLSAGIKYSF